LSKHLLSLVLLVWPIMVLTGADASAASKRHGLSRCAYADCVGRHVSRSLAGSASYKPRFKREVRDHAVLGAKKDVRRKRRIEDSVSRLQKKIARQRLEHRTGLDRHEREVRRRTFNHIYGDSPSRSLTCRRARLFLLGQGFYRISPLDCQGRTFTYLARRKGDTVRILVVSRYGRIISTNPL
jgi:hypothetical protein